MAQWILILRRHGRNKYVRIHSMLTTYILSSFKNILDFKLLLKVGFKDKIKIVCIQFENCMYFWYRLTSFVLNQFLYISDKVFVDILFIQPLTNRLSYINIFKIYCAWRLGKVLDIYPGLYSLSKTLASCRTFDCIFSNDTLSLIGLSYRLYQFDQGALFHAVVWRSFLQGIRRSIFNKDIFVNTQNITFEL